MITNVPFYWKGNWGSPMAKLHSRWQSWYGPQVYPTPHQCWSNVTSERLASWEAVSCLEEVTPLHWKHTKQRNEWHWKELGTLWLTPSLYSHFALPGNPLRPSKTYIHTAPSLRWEAGREGEMPAFCRQRQGIEPGPAQETRAAYQLGPS